MSYELGDAMPAPLVDTVDPGTNILVSGPAMSGKRQLMFDVLGHGADRDEGSVIVTANDGGSQIYEQFRDVIDDDAYVRIVDSVGSESGGEYEDVIRTCGSPGDLTGIGIEFSQLSKETESQGVEQVRVAFDSLTPVLMYVDLERLFRFLHVFTRQIQSKGWIGLFSIDPESHDSQAINTLNQLFDGVIQLRVPDDGPREIRTRGFGQSPSEWVTYE
ncbi:MAG: RAD55 family ATPase [Halodesulfurarchaeum sp.]